jgi:hypothetical protein
MTGFWRPPYATDFCIARGSGGGGTQTVTQQTQLPQFVQNQVGNDIASANNLAAQPYVTNPYSGVAPQTQPTSDAYNEIGQLQGDAQATGYTPAESQLTGLLGQAAPITADQINSNVSSLMKPYSDIVIDPSLQLMRQQLAQTKQGVGANAASVGAFGGSRQGVEEGVADSQEALQAGQLKSGLLQSGYNAVLPTASNIAAANQNLGTWATSLLPQVATTASNQGLTEANALNTVGQQEQQQQQNVMDVNAANFEAARAWPAQGLGLQEQAISTAPFGQSSQSTGPAPASNVAGQVIGGVSAAASVAAAAVAI